jgi:hypothetical protein
MATRSTIWIKNVNGNFDGIYCHWDGYLKNNGKILVENYKKSEKIKKLIQLGSISSLDKEIECPDGHSFNNPINGYTVAYHRDRGDTFEMYSDIPFEKLETYFEEYNYFYINGVWKYTCHDKNDMKIVSLEL